MGLELTGDHIVITEMRARNRGAEIWRKSLSKVQILHGCQKDEMPEGLPLDHEYQDAEIYLSVLTKRHNKILKFESEIAAKHWHTLLLTAQGFFGA